MISVEEAKKKIIENVKTLETIEIPFTEAEGFVLSKDIISSVNLPYFTNSQMDGYALKSEDTKGASETNPVKLKVIGEIKAGDFPNYIVKSGDAAKIMTGAPIPEGADSVIMVEYTDENNGSVNIVKEVFPKEFIRFEGEEIKEGEIALKKETELNPASIGFIAELGITNIKVFGESKVSIVVTGEEVIGLDEELKPGKIRDTNSVALASVLRRENAELLHIALAGDDPVEIRQKISKCLDTSNLLLITGGVSVGDYDYVKDVLKELGVKEIFWRVAQKPGGPLYFGKKNETLVFGLPGNPASVLVCYYEYVRPALRRMIGRSDVHLLGLVASLSEEIGKKQDGKTYFLRGWVEKEGEKFCVKPTGAQGSHILKSFALSNCLIIVPSDVNHLPSGSTVKVHLLPV